MQARRIHDHEDTSDAQNFFLDLLLGLASSARRLERLVRRLGPRPARPESTGSEPSRPKGERAGSLHALDAFVLGLVSFSRTIRVKAQVMEEASPPPPPARDALETPRAPARDLLL